MFPTYELAYFHSILLVWMADGIHTNWASAMMAADYLIEKGQHRKSAIFRKVWFALWGGNREEVVATLTGLAVSTPAPLGWESVETDCPNDDVEFDYIRKQEQLTEQYLANRY